MKKKSRINKGKLVLLGLAGAAFVTSLVYDNIKKNEKYNSNNEENNEENSYEEIIRE